MITLAATANGVSLSHLFSSRVLGSLTASISNCINSLVDFDGFADQNVHVRKANSKGGECKGPFVRAVCESEQQRLKSLQLLGLGTFYESHLHHAKQSNRSLLGNTVLRTRSFQRDPRWVTVAVMINRRKADPMRS